MNIHRLPPPFACVLYLLVWVLLLPFTTPVAAAEFAARRILGFSPDGLYFAFEQYGVQDGSGFPYAAIFVIRTTHDEWVKGSPFRVLLRDERARLRQARKDAMSKAAPLLKKLAIVKPGRLLASNPPGELSADPHHVEVNTSRFVNAPPERWTFRLEEIPLASARCSKYLNNPATGFRLTTQSQGGAPQPLHEDSTIPDSRGCPLRYAISDIVIYQPGSGGRSFAILISVYAFGFEGPNRRFLAVTKRLP